jgi:putative ABC transport system permease protein
VGVLDLFPTAYPGEGEFFVANLDYIFMQLGGPVPYYVWAKVQDGVDAPKLAAGIEQAGFTILELQDARQKIADALGQPGRIGLFGFLSLGFIVTTVLSMLALALQAFVVYRQRFIQLGILRAIGLSGGQVAASLAGEQMLVTVLSILGGAALGLITSHLFIPFMQIGPSETALVPPFTVAMDWRVTSYMVLALVGAALVVTVADILMLSRLQLFRAIKLGETMG